MSTEVIESRSVEYTAVEGLADTRLRELTLEAAEWYNTRKVADEEIDRLKEEAKNILSTFRVQGSVNVEGYKWVQSKGQAGRRTLSVDKLLKRGVSVAVIDACTDVGQPGKPGISLRKIEEGA